MVLLAKLEMEIKRNRNMNTSIDELFLSLFFVWTIWPKIIVLSINLKFVMRPSVFNHKWDMKKKWPNRRPYYYSQFGFSSKVLMCRNDILFTTTAAAKSVPLIVWK